MESCKQLIINRLTGGGRLAKIFDYSRQADFLCTQRCGQIDSAKEQLTRLRDEGQYNIVDPKSPLLSTEVSLILQGLRQDVVNQLLNNISALEYIDTLMLVNDTKPTIVSSTIDDIINAALSSGYMKKPSDWAAVVMLANDLGKSITATTLGNALSNNAEAIIFGLPRRQSIDQAYIEHTKKNAFPNWSRNTQKEERYYKIAEAIYDLMQVFAQ